MDLRIDIALSGQNPLQASDAPPPDIDNTVELLQQHLAGIFGGANQSGAALPQSAVNAAGAAGVAPTTGGMTLPGGGTLVAMRIGTVLNAKQGFTPDGAFAPLSNGNATALTGGPGFLSRGSIAANSGTMPPAQKEVAQQASQTEVMPQASQNNAAAQAAQASQTEVAPQASQKEVAAQASQTEVAPQASQTDAAAQTQTEAATEEPPAPPTFGQAAKTLDDFMHTPEMAGKMVSADDLRDIANGVGMGAGASEEMKTAARALMADGGAEFQSKLGGKDNIVKLSEVSKFVANDKDTPLSDDEMATLSVLERHGAALKGKTGDLQAKIDDPKTPSDLKAALQKLQKDPSLLDMLDAGKNGKVDGKIGGDDVSRLVGKHPEMVDYNRKQADTFVANYIPSDDLDDDAKPRPITENDAMREMYRYSDYLPKNISKQSLQDIVDGTGNEGKAPPQLVAAAKYYLDHPSQFQTIAGTGGSVSRGHMEDAISKNVGLDQNETDTLQTIGANKDAFFGGGNLTRDKLKKMAADPNASDDVKTAAQQLLNDPMLFGMLDNGKKGSSGNLIYAADDGKIGAGDFDKFTQNLKSYGKPVTPPAASEASTDPKDVAAAQSMKAGTEDQPEEKKSKGGGFMKFLQGVLHVFSKILDVVSTVLGALAKIPGIGELFALASVGAKVSSEGLNTASVAAGGGSKEEIEAAAKQIGIGAAEAVVGAVTVPGAGGAIVKGAVEGVEAGVTAGAKEGAEAAAQSVAVKEGLKEGSMDAAHDQASDQAMQAYQNHRVAA